MLPGLASARTELRDAAARVIARAAFDWAGLPVPEAELPRRARQMVDCVEHAGTVGPAWLKGLLARKRIDRWASGLIEDVRAGRLDPPARSPLAVVARWREPDGDLLPVSVAAVEIVNATRPAIAVCWLVLHCARSLILRPDLAPRVASDSGYRHGFVQEVRRLYPFAPVLAVRARRAFDRLGHRFEAGELVVLDLYGTSRGPHWDDPGAFRPERHAEGEPGPFDMIPQGGGDHATGHRCPGEWLTIRIMEIWSRWLAGALSVEAEGSLALDMGAFPSVPKGTLRAVGWSGSEGPFTAR
jgi:fatty-acid peroxygenase